MSTSANRATAGQSLDKRVAPPIDPAWWGLRGVTLFAVVLLPTVFNPHRSDVFAPIKAVVLEAVVIAAAVCWWLLDAPPHAAGTRLPRLVPIGISLAIVGLFAGWVNSPIRGAEWWGEPGQLQGLATSLLILALIPLSAAAHRHVLDLVVTLEVVSLGSLAVSIYALVQWLGFDPVWGELSGGRVFSSLGQANALGAYLVLGAIVSAGAAWITSGLRRATHVVSAGASLAALALTMSRGGYFAFTTGAGWFGASLLFARGQRDGWPHRPAQLTGRRLAAIALAASLAVVFGARRVMASVANRATSIRHLGADESIYQHEALWRAATAMIVDHPGVGLGPDGFATAFEAYRDRILPTKAAWQLALFRPESPHNQPLARFVDGGLPAGVGYLLLWLGGIVLLVSRARRVEAVERTAVLIVSAALMAHLVATLFITGELASDAVAAVLLGGAMICVGSGKARPRRPSILVDSA